MTPEALEIYQQGLAVLRDFTGKAVSGGLWRSGGEYEVKLFRQSTARLWSKSFWRSLERAPQSLSAKRAAQLQFILR